MVTLLPTFYEYEKDFGAPQMQGQTTEDESVSLRAEIDRLGEREAASREILEVISESRDDERPVFQAILENACRLCDTPLALLADVDEVTNTVGYAAHTGARPEFAEVLQKIRLPLNDERHGLVQAVVRNEVIQVADARDSDLYREGNPGRTLPVDIEGVTTFLVVPLSKNGKGFGAIVLYRREVRPYTEKDISLIQGFAAQAVIAIENVRQFRKVQARLERETATNNILNVMSQSRNDEVPVFDTILTNATRLCNAPMAGLVLVDKNRKKYEMVASLGANPEFVAALKENPPDLDPERFAAARAIVEKRVVHVEDLASPKLYGASENHRIITTQTEGTRTALFVPLILDKQSVGAIGLWRREVKAFRRGH